MREYVSAIPGSSCYQLTAFRATLTLAYSTIVNTRIRFLLLLLWKTNSVALVLQTSVMADREMSSQCVQYRLFRGISHLGFHSYSREFRGPGYP